LNGIIIQERRCPRCGVGRSGRLAGSDIAICFNCNLRWQAADPPGAAGARASDTSTADRSVPVLEVDAVVRRAVAAQQRFEPWSEVRVDTLLHDAVQTVAAVALRGPDGRRGSPVHGEERSSWC
jgi:hypothetical protein